VIVVTGPLLLYILENNLDLTLASLYGKILIVKLSLAAIMIGIGSYNQIVIQKQASRINIIGEAITANGSSTPFISKTNNTNNSKVGKWWRRKEESYSPNDNGKSNKSSNKFDSGKQEIYQLIYRFSKSTKAEAIVGLALLGVVAILVNTGLPASEFQNYLQKQQQQQSTAELALPINSIQRGFSSVQFVENGSRIILSIDPFTVGNNNLRISFLDSNRLPIDIKSVQLEFSEINKGIGPIKIDSRQVSKGIFLANGAFGLPGHWDVQIEGIQNKPNSPNLVAAFDGLNIKPSLDQLKFNIDEFKMPSNNSQPLYPTYDTRRNVIWVGDTAIDSGRIFEFDLNSSKYVEHKINDTSIVTVMALDPKTQILWFADPLMKHLGRYDPNTHINEVFKIPIEEFLPSGIAIDNMDNIWLTSARPTNGTLLKFNPLSKNFTTVQLPTKNATTLGIKIDDMTGQIWIAEDVGKLANIDPANNFTIREYAPLGQNNTLKSPTALLVDPLTQNIYISEHDGHAVSVFNPLLKTFKRFPSLNKNGLPFGMALDNYGNLWVAEHTINKIAVIDPLTGLNKEVSIPMESPFVQWITSDSKGNIWLAEQKGNSLGLLTSSANSIQTSTTLTTSPQQTNNSNNVKQPNIISNTITRLGLSYADIIGPSIAGGIIISALFYAKSIVDLKKNMMHVDKRKFADNNKK
jgi:copper transport protein